METSWERGLFRSEAPTSSETDLASCWELVPLLASQRLSPAGWGCSWALQGFKLPILPSWLFSWAARGKLGQQDTAGIWFTASDFGSLLRSHWREWDGSSVRLVISGICPNVTPFSPTCPEWSARCKIMCKAAQPCLLPSLSAKWGWVLGLKGCFHRTLHLRVGSCVSCVSSVGFFQLIWDFLAFPYRSDAGICRCRLSVKNSRCLLVWHVKGGFILHNFLFSFSQLVLFGSGWGGNKHCEFIWIEIN